MHRSDDQTGRPALYMVVGDDDHSRLRWQKKQQPGSCINEKDIYIDRAISYVVETTLYTRNHENAKGSGDTKSSFHHHRQ